MHGGAADAQDGLGGGGARRTVRTTIPTRPLPVRSIGSTATSRLPGRTPCGSATSRTWRRGRASAMSPSSSTCSLGASLAGERHAVPMQASCWMLWSRPCTSVVPLRAAGWFITRTADRKTWLYGTQSAWPEQGSSRPSARRRQRRQRPGRDDQRPVQGGGDPSARAVALLRGGRVRHLEWVDWYNHRRLLAPIGNVPPVEAEARYHANVGDQALAA